jgi:hypothetical protein
MIERCRVAQGLSEALRVRAAAMVADPSSDQAKAEFDQAVAAYREHTAGCDDCKRWMMEMMEGNNG